jgi:ATP-binding protein involved in chromosome partitioning
MITEAQVLHALGQVDDPDLKKDLVTLGMIRDLNIQGEAISFTVMLTTPACPMKDLIEQACRNAIRLMVPEARTVNILMSSETRNNRPANGILPGVKNIIAVASGKGGVGKSSVAANLATALARSGAKTGLLDADIYGPSVPTLFGIQEAPEMRDVEGRSIMVPHVQDGIKLMSIGFLADPKQAIVWRGPMISSAIRQMVQDTDWGELDYLIVDLPPGTGDAQLTLVQQVPLTCVIMVTTPHELAFADARRAMAMFRVPGIEKTVLGVVENMSWFSPPEAPEKRYYLFGTEGGKLLAEEGSVPLLMQIPLFEQGSQSARFVPEHPAFAFYLELAGNVARYVSILNNTEKS